MHPSYSRSTLKADMAMIKLKTPAKLNTRVSLACLPKNNQYPSLGKQCYLAGKQTRSFSSFFFEVKTTW